MSQHYPRIDVPVEIVHGQKDPFVLPRIHAAPLAGQIEGANLTVLEGVGHMPHHVAPVAVVAAIDRAARRAGLR
jgi:pimeloyl-ACP methyl ester carboxylesterase